LLPMAWICNGKFFSNDSKQTEDNLTSKNAQQQAKSPETKIKKTDDKNVGNKSTGSSGTQKNDSEKSMVSSGTPLPLKANSPASLTPAASPVQSRETLNQSGLKHQKIKGTDNRSGDRLALKDNDHAQKNVPVASADIKEKPGDAAPGDGVNHVANDGTKNGVPAENKTTGTTPDTRNDATAKTNMLDGFNDAQRLSAPTKTAGAEKMDSAAIQKKQVAQQAPKKMNPGKTKIHFLYAGVVGGGDVSTVAFQTVKNTGYTAGILLGYQLNKKLSIESGFMFDKKYYYTDGKYFSTAKINIPSTISILNANGDCYMFELPVNIKYNWTSTAKSNWFSTIGFSSYFMKKENYNYEYEYAGWPPNNGLFGSKSYSESTANWFSVINLSGGYTHTLGKAGSLRIEPYLKVPLQKLGVGNLSIWSTGIYVSFVKKIF
ncbi:MAG TPA: hypothetical protein VKR53_00375, partial [Puia sp.]|nr:hypothetical protein [Puia sp.]